MNVIYLTDYEARIMSTEELEHEFMSMGWIYEDAQDVLGALDMYGFWVYHDQGDNPITIVTLDKIHRTVMGT